MKYSKILSDILVTTGLAILVSTFLGATITSFGAAARRVLLIEGYNYYCTKDFDKAEKLWKLSSLFPVPPSDEIRMKTASWLGVMYLEQGRYHAAEKILAPELRRISYLFGDRNLWTAATEDNLGGCYFEQKRYTEALALFSHCLLVRKELLGSEDLKTLCTLEHYAITLHKLGKPREAEKLLRQCLESLERSLPRNDVRISSCTHNLDCVCRQIQRSEAVTQIVN